MPNLYDPEQVERLIHSITDLQRQITKHADQLVITERRSRFARAVAIFACAVGLFSVIVGGYALAQGRDAQDAIDRVEAFTIEQDVLRAEQMVSACIQFNSQRAETRLTLTDALLSIVPGTDVTTNEAREASIERLSESQQRAYRAWAATVVNRLPYRDCSREGITAYFKNPPVDPAVPN